MSRSLIVLIGLLLAAPAAAQVQGPLLKLSAPRFDSWRADATFAGSVGPAAGALASARFTQGSDRTHRALIGGVIGAAVGVVACTIVSTISDDSADGGLSFCPADSYLLIGGAGFVLGFGIGWIT